MMTIDARRTSSYLEYLPAIFSEDPLLGRFLLAFEQVLTGLDGSENEPRRGLEQIIAAIPQLFDPLTTPREFLDWLAGWVALGLRADWREEQKREFLARIVPLYRRRGTKQNLIELLKIYTGLDPEISEGGNTVFQIGDHSTVGVDTQLNGNAPHYFRVHVTIPNPDPATLQRQNQIIRAMIDLEKPAHTAYDYHPAHTTMQIGVHSQIGVDTLLGDLAH
ncbi:phage tail protein [Candidatus Accumulibacter cognatus]|uniref:Phage tail protein domain protein n=1 Tax=Candidatus Accumulibacter cognatus TaxID=2954383 RepID=A0A080M1T9_9PROT|nr:phage tail protein [Candidatus Accumulibacter cognatus]KFB75046.1 MAG: phage tail protein domain protein [Candidatus Accumulibacter cognatus]